MRWETLVNAPPNQRRSVRVQPGSEFQVVVVWHPVPDTWLDQLSYSRRDDELTTNAQVPGTLRTPFHSRNLILRQPIQLIYQ